MKKPKAILLSGGMDSVSLAYWFREEITHGITIDYGQRSALKEIEVSKKICHELNFKHEIIKVDCQQMGSGEMIGGKPLDISPQAEWWPYRNQLLITLASMKAIGLNVESIIFGSVKTDKKFKDGTPRFSRLIQKIIKMQEGSVQIIFPAINLTTLQLIKKSEIPENLLFWAHSCHTGNIACGNCNGCRKYLMVMEFLT